MAVYEEFEIDQGADTMIELRLVNVDGSAKNLTGYSVNSKMKKSYNSDSDDTYELSPIIQTPATSGILNLNFTNSQTDNFPAGRFVYDVEISFIDSDGFTITERILEGRITVTPSVTK